MRILRQVEIVVVLMRILFANSVLYFSQYVLESSEITRFRGSISMRFKSFEPLQFILHASQFAFKSVEK